MVTMKTHEFPIMVNGYDVPDWMREHVNKFDADSRAVIEQSEMVRLYGYVDLGAYDCWDNPPNFSMVNGITWREYLVSRYLIDLYECESREDDTSVESVSTAKLDEDNSESE